MTTKLSAAQSRDPAMEEAAIARWLETDLGCSDVSIRRMHRWRPIYVAEAERGGEKVQFFLKGQRTWPTHPYPLKYECDVQRVLWENGIRVPEIVAWIPEPATIVMEWVEGGRDAGLIQQAIESGSQMTPDRWEASLKYMDRLAEMHAIPVDRFAAAGAQLPEDNAALMLANFERFDAMAREADISDPFIDFMALWLRRNCPQNRAGTAFLTGDCGQFLSDGPEITCLMDFEIGHVGDPMRDLACYRGRHPIENMGDLPTLFERYAKASGTPIDWTAMAFHTVSFLAEAYYGPFIGLHDEGPGGDWVESFVQVAIIGRRALEALAELEGITLDSLSLPEPEQTPLEDLAFARLSAEIARLPEHPQMQAWQRKVLGTLPETLAHIGHYRRWREDCYLADVAQLTGTPGVQIADADAHLQAFIARAGPDSDAALVRLLHRKLLRDCLIIAGPDAPADHIALAQIEPVLHLAEEPLAEH